VNGLESACQLVAQRLRTALPAKTEEMRGRLSVADPADLPDVAVVYDHELGHIPLEEWPAVMVVGQTLERMTRDDVKADGTYWLCTYRIRVYVWARGEGFGHTDRIRKRLTLAVREVLMQLRKVTGNAQLDDSSMGESYSDLDVDQADATVGGAYLEFLLVVQEVLGTVPTKGVVETPVIDTAFLPPHPAL
jgi:hypothetical protein